MRSIHKSWQDKRPGWTRRVRWLQDTLREADATDIRLEFIDEFGRVNWFYKNAAEAQVDYNDFRSNQITTRELMVRPVPRSCGHKVLCMTCSVCARFMYDAVNNY